MISNHVGMSLPISEEIDAMKYRQTGEDFKTKCTRIANALKENDEHFHEFRDILLDLRFLPAGRVQNAMGSIRETTAYNCFVSGTIQDSMRNIMARATEAAETMRRGGGIGYDFSRLRPRGDTIKSLDSKASGAVSFMGIFDSICQTIASSGHRRGAQMGVMRIDHPDIMEFITAKNNSDKLTGFNVSIGVTDEFMECLLWDKPFDLKFEGRVYETIDPKSLWDTIMYSTWDWAEPGVLFIDTINRKNNLHYCETIEATNPCGEQPLPPYGACLLGSFNLVKYVSPSMHFDFMQFAKDIHSTVPAMDNVIDRTIYPLNAQEQEAKNKRRMGLGVTGLANSGEMLGLKYGTAPFLHFTRQVLETLRNEAYSASAELAMVKGSFPLFNKSEYMKGEFIKDLPDWLQEKISEVGIRNSHLTSIAPTGTISLTADNVSSGIEPPFMLQYDRTIQTFDGAKVETVKDYAYSKGVEGVTANNVTPEQHLEVLSVAQQFVDSAVSKTCNIGDDFTYEEFKNLYEEAWRLGCKGITTFRSAGRRFGILNATKPEPQKTDDTGSAEACYFDPETGLRSCE